MPRLLGIAPLTHLELTPAAMVDNAAACGYDFLGIRLHRATPNEPWHDCRPGTPMLRETLARLAATGLKVVDIEVFRLFPDTVAADYAPYFEAGALLGARHALFAPQDADAARLADTIGALGELAASFGLGIEAEPTPWYEVTTLQACARLLAASGAADAGLVVDTIHFDRAGETAAGLAAFEPRLFRYMQLCDAPAERPQDLETRLFQARAERMIPGRGGLPLADIVRALPAGLPISLEVPSASLARSLDVAARSRLLLQETREWLGAHGLQ